ncbi:TetR/AcrR family transcriptional regulator [Streptomyces sp. NK08204]|uniref:TetR/AcrR family transcriptional regulator n=1 Tax=Streptomyces sp. NK08204 TaxID=2873260 RepID=UPI001CED91D5|nr:TetR family transcriptional regulator [Streptomyces sp. NK08204]
MEIARAAAALFVRQGLRATRAEDIAQAAGIAPRTFYRYFATKEEAVAPLYAAGAQRWTEAVREAPPGLTVPEALEHAVRHILAPGAGVSAASWEWVRTLIHLAVTSPALRKVWAEVCQASEAALAEILAARTAATAMGAPDAVSVENDTVDTNDTSARDVDDAEEGVARPVTVTPRHRFAAAVAGAAVRVAMESWATTTSPAAGPDGPGPLALRNLEALRGFDWGGEN